MQPPYALDVGSLDGAPQLAEVIKLRAQLAVAEGELQEIRRRNGALEDEVLDGRSEAARLEVLCSTTEERLAHNGRDSEDEVAIRRSLEARVAKREAECAALTEALQAQTEAVSEHVEQAAQLRSLRMRMAGTLAENKSLREVIWRKDAELARLQGAIEGVQAEGVRLSDALLAAEQARALAEGRYARVRRLIPTWAVGVVQAIRRQLA
jgi:chromosome segregation ATPase